MSGTLYSIKRATKDVLERISDTITRIVYYVEPSPTPNPALVKIRNNWEAYKFSSEEDAVSYLYSAILKIGLGKIDRITDPEEVLRKYPVEEYRKRLEEIKRRYS